MTSPEQHLTHRKNLWHLAKTVTRSWQHFAFLKICQHCSIHPKGLSIKSRPCISKPSSHFTEQWDAIKTAASKSLQEILIMEQFNSANKAQSEFWTEIIDRIPTLENMDPLIKELLEIQTSIDKLYQNWSETSHKKLLKIEPHFIKLSSNLQLPHFTFEDDLQNFIIDTQIYKLNSLETVTDNRTKRKSISKSVVDIESDVSDSFFEDFDSDNVLLDSGESNKSFIEVTPHSSLVNTEISSDKVVNNTVIPTFSVLDDRIETQTDPVLDNLEITSNDKDSTNGTQKTAKSLANGRLEGFFVSENIFNLSKKELNEHHINLL